MLFTALDANLNQGHPTMQDAVSVHTQQDQDWGQSFDMYAVFDGHGLEQDQTTGQILYDSGKAIAEWLRDNFHRQNNGLSIMANMRTRRKTHPNSSFLNIVLILFTRLLGL